MSTEEVTYSLADLLRVMERLRDPDNGCPWDVAQTFESIVPSTLEECYELAAAIEHKDYAHIAEELGDVLFQVTFYAQLGREQELFSFDDVVHVLVDKLLRRHPHVFRNGCIEGVVDKVVDVDHVMQSWEAIKQTEREGKSQTGAMADVPLALPALPRAQKLQKRAASVGLDWSSHAAVLEKLSEELRELEEARGEGVDGHIEEEVGDILFTCVNLARHLGVDSEAALRRSSQKFETRFGVMEELAAERDQSLNELDADALDELWNEVKSGLLAAR